MPKKRADRFLIWTPFCRIETNQKWIFQTIYKMMKLKMLTIKPTDCKLDSIAPDFIVFDEYGGMKP